MEPSLELFPYGNEFRIFFGLPTAVELNNNQMPQTSRVIRGEAQKRLMFGTPGLLQFSGLLDHIFGLCTCLAKV